MNQTTKSGDSPNTSYARTPKATLLSRLFDQTLDVHGEIYGDEQERLRWYEGITVAASLQWIIVPWVIAVSIWMGGRPVTSYLLAITAAMYFPQLLTYVYAIRSGVRLPKFRSAKALFSGLLSGGAYLAIVIGAVRAYDDGLDPDGVKGALVGGPVGMIVALLLARIFMKRRAAAQARLED
jgi:hypothetical protein